MRPPASVWIEHLSDRDVVHVGDRVAVGDPCQIGVRVYPHGPVLVRGAEELRDAQGDAFVVERATVAMCRCIDGGDRLLCDGTHRFVERAARSSDPG